MIWDEVGLEDGSRREKARFWRDELERRLEDLPARGLDDALLPVLYDTDVPSSAARFLRTGPRSSRWRLIERSGPVRDAYRDAVDRLGEQIRHAADWQIVAYAENYWRRRYRR